MSWPSSYSPISCAFSSTYSTLFSMISCTTSRTGYGSLCSCETVASD